eukprot:TRINITY_DN2162_c0_g7_i1.p2 TRINITY_DN2162_c0_g7~~TRINITY_DN2162_c0_g7_i1.p2  ORF type:complete len:204 (-),score=17.45 TRINITY_DN2162_c0_g7_i1:337-948(-)
MEMDLVPGIGNEVLVFTSACALVISTLVFLKPRQTTPAQPVPPAAGATDPVPPSGDQIRVTVRFASGLDIVLQLARSTSIEALRTMCLGRLRPEDAGKHIRFFRMGQAVEDGNLGAIAGTSESVLIQATLGGAARPAGRTRALPFDSGLLLLGVCGGSLGVMWYFLVTSSQLFSKLSIGCLVGLTAAFGMFAKSLQEECHEVG